MPDPINEKLYRQILASQRGRSAPNIGASATMAEAEYMNYRQKVTPAMQKMMWPSIIATMAGDPIYAAKLLKNVSSPTLKQALKTASGVAGGAGYLIPKVLSEGLKSRRLAYEKQYAPKLGAVGSASRAFDSLSTLRYLMTLPGYLAQTAGFGTSLLKHIPRPEMFLTGTAGAAIRHGAGGISKTQFAQDAAFKAAEAAAIKKGLSPAAAHAAGTAAASQIGFQGGGILTSLYGGTKSGVNLLTGGTAKSLYGTAAKKSPLFASAAGGLDKAITNALSSPFSVMMGITAAQIGLSIYKSIKLSKLQPTRQMPDKFARRLYSAQQSQTAMNRVLAMATRGNIDPQTLSFMVLQIQLGELQRMNMQLAGFRGEYQSEVDFIRQEKEKGSESHSNAYGQFVLGEDDRSTTQRALDWVEQKLGRAKAKYDPVSQLINWAVGLTQGKWILPKTETSRIAASYGFASENEMIKKRAESFGLATDQTRLLHMTSKTVLQMAPNYEAKMLAILSASFDIQRLIAAEAVTIRSGAFGLEKNVLYRKDQSALKRFMADLGEKLNPFNLPGINAISNLVGLGFRAIGGIPKIAEKLFGGAGKVASSSLNWLLGEDYIKLRGTKELLKASGLYKDYGQRAQEYLAIGLPGIQAEMKDIQIEQLESLRNLVEIQAQALEISGGKYTYKEMLNKGLLIWDSELMRYVTPQEEALVKKGRTTQMVAVKEEAFRKGPLGKLLLALDTMFGDMYGTKQPYSLEGGVERLGFSERTIGKLEQTIFGKQRTLSTYGSAEVAGQQLTSLQPRTGISETSEEAETARRKFAFLLTKKSQEVLAGSSIVAAPIIGTMLGSLPIGGLFSVAAALSYLIVRFKQKKKVAEAMKATMQFASPEEELFAKYLQEAQIPVETAAAVHAIERFSGFSTTGGRGSGYSSTAKGGVLDIHDLHADSVEMWKLEYLEQISGHIKNIQSYLGASENLNLFTLLTQGQPYAEVTVVDQDGRPVFFGKGNAKRFKAIPHRLALPAPAPSGSITSHADYSPMALVGEQGPELISFHPMNYLRKKIAAIEEKKKQNEEINWHQKVILLLSGILKKKEGPQGVKPEEKKGGILGWLWDKIKDIGFSGVGKLAGLVLGGYGLSKLFGWIFGGQQLSEADDSIRLKIKNWLLEQIGKIPTGYIMGAGAVFGASVGGILGIQGAIAGAILGGAAGYIASKVIKDHNDANDKDKQGILDQSMSDMIFKYIPDDLLSAGAMGTALLTVSKFTKNPMILTSATILAGASVAVWSRIKKFEDEKGDLIDKAEAAITGAAKGEMASYWKNMKDYALIAGAVGVALPGVGLPGILTLGLIGAMSGALVTWAKNEHERIKNIPDAIPPGFREAKDFGPENQEKYKQLKKLQESYFTQIKQNPDKEYGLVVDYYNKAKLLGLSDEAIVLQNNEVRYQRPEETMTKSEPIKQTGPNWWGKGRQSPWDYWKSKISGKSKTSAVPSNTATPVANPATATTGAVPAATTANAPSGRLTINQILEQVSKETGTPLDYLKKISQAESGGNPYENNGVSRGLFQFDGPTWAQTAAKYGPKFGYTPAAMDIFDPMTNARMGAMFINDNMATLKSKGYTPSVENVYALHALGNGGLQLLKAAKEAPGTTTESVIRQIFSKNPGFAQKVIDQNARYYKGKTVEQTMEEMKSSLNGATSANFKKSEGWKMSNFIDTETPASDRFTAVKNAFTKFFSGVTSDISESIFHGGVSNPSAQTQKVKQDAEAANMTRKAIEATEKATEKVQKAEQAKQEAVARRNKSVQNATTQRQTAPAGATSISPEMDKLIAGLFNTQIEHTVRYNQQYPLGNNITHNWSFNGIG